MGRKAGEWLLYELRRRNGGGDVRSSRYESVLVGKLFVRSQNVVDGFLMVGGGVTPNWEGWEHGTRLRQDYICPRIKNQCSARSNQKKKKELKKSWYVCVYKIPVGANTSPRKAIRRLLQIPLRFPFSLFFFFLKSLLSIQFLLKWTLKWEWFVSLSEKNPWWMVLLRIWDGAEENKKNWKMGNWNCKTGTHPLFSNVRPSVCQLAQPSIFSLAFCLLSNLVTYQKKKKKKGDPHVHSPEGRSQISTKTKNEWKIRTCALDELGSRVNDLNYFRSPDSFRVL